MSTSTNGERDGVSREAARDGEAAADATAPRDDKGTASTSESAGAVASLDARKSDERTRASRAASDHETAKVARDASEAGTTEPASALASSGTLAPASIAPASNHDDARSKVDQTTGIAASGTPASVAPASNHDDARSKVDQTTGIAASGTPASIAPASNHDDARSKVDQTTGIAASGTPASIAPASARDGAPRNLERTNRAASKTGAATRSTGAIVLGTWKRYAVPMLVLTAIACAPLAYVAIAFAPPGDRADAQKLIRIAWVMGATAWMFRIVAVGAMAPAARAVAAGIELSQLAALRAGARGLVRAIVPCALAIGAVVMGGMALAVPGLLIFVMLSMTAASERGGLEGPLVDSVEVARKNFRSVAIAAVGMVVVDLAIVAVLYVVFVGDIPAKAKPVHLEGPYALFQIAAIAMFAVSPFAASVLASIHARARR